MSKVCRIIHTLVTHIIHTLVTHTLCIDMYMKRYIGTPPEIVCIYRRLFVNVYDICVYQRSIGTDLLRQIQPEKNLQKPAQLPFYIGNEEVSSRLRTLHHCAPHCNTLQHAAAALHCTTLRHTATQCTDVSTRE